MPELVGEDGGELLQVPLDWWRASYPPPSRCAAAIGRIMHDWPKRSAAARARAERLFRKEDWVEAHGRIFGTLLGASDDRSEQREDPESAPRLAGFH
jgi:hypothetical protein